MYKIVYQHKYLNTQTYIVYSYDIPNIFETFVESIVPWVYQEPQAKIVAHRIWADWACSVTPAND